MTSEHWRQIRALFDAVSELPREQWQTALAAQCPDAAIREEVWELLRSQTAGLSRVSNRLDTALARALAPEFGIGDRLGPWRLTERIAQGGMGTVFKAERADGVYQRTVAIKLLHGLPGGVEVERLGIERQVLADLQLPHVARLYDGGTTPSGHPYLVMEFIDGVPLDEWCEQHHLGLDARVALFLEVAGIVQAAHERLVLHCDLKPRNVLVQPDGQPVLLDFGLAQLLNEAREGQDSGYCTPSYASPELIRGELIGAASDVYSLGVMLLELLSARPCIREPQDITQPVDLPSVHAKEGLAWRRRLRGDLDAIVRRACALDVSERYRTVEALVEDIRRYQQHRPVRAREGDSLYHARKYVHRNWHAVVMAGGVAVLMLLFVIGLLQTRRQAQEEAAVARQVSNFMVGVFETADPFLRTERGEDELTSRQLLDKAALQVTGELHDAPVELARMQAVLGAAYQNSGAAQQAERQLQQAYEGFMRPDVRRPQDAAAVLASLSTLKTNEGAGAEGQSLAERGLKLLDSDAPTEARARLLAARAGAQANQQRYDHAEVSYREARAVYDQLPPLDNGAQLHELIYNTGLMYLRWGRQAEAERNFRQVIDSLHGRRTSLVLAAETRLAQILRERGDYAQALPLLRAGMEQAVALYGPSSSFVVTQHEALADLYQDMGDYAAADEQFRARQALSAVIDGEQSVSYSMGLFNYGSLHELRGDIAGAERLYRRAWEIRRTQLGAEAPATMRAEAGLGNILMRQGRMEEAGEYILHADKGMAAALPADAPGRQEVRLYRIDWLIRQNRLDEAASLLSGLQGDLPAFLTLQLLKTRADLAQRRGEGANTLALRRNAVEFSAALYGNEQMETLLSRAALAESLLQFGHGTLALEELRKVAPALRRLQVDTSPDRRKVEGLMLLAGGGKADASAGMRTGGMGTPLDSDGP